MTLRQIAMMVKGKRLAEWEQVVKLCQVVLWPHLTPAERQRQSPLQIVPPDLIEPGESKHGMTGAQVRGLRVMFPKCEKVKAADVRVSA